MVYCRVSDLHIVPKKGGVMIESIKKHIATAAPDNVARAEDVKSPYGMFTASHDTEARVEDVKSPYGMFTTSQDINDREEKAK